MTGETLTQQQLPKTFIGRVLSSIRGSRNGRNSLPLELRRDNGKEAGPLWGYIRIVEKWKLPLLGYIGIMKGKWKLLWGYIGYRVYCSYHPVPKQHPLVLALASWWDEKAANYWKALVSLFLSCPMCPPRDSKPTTRQLANPLGGSPQNSTYDAS